MSKESKTTKSEILELLEKMPTDCEDIPYEETKYSEWKKQLTNQLNDALDFYEEGGIYGAIEDLKKEIKDLKSSLSNHKHLQSGEAVEQL